MGRKNSEMMLKTGPHSSSFFLLIFTITFFGSCSDEPTFPNGRYSVITGWEHHPQKLSSKYCGECHKETHQDWKEGMHSQSWQDPLFQEGFKIEPRTWCVRCHAPLAVQLNEFKNPKGSKGLLEEGINCAACHVRNGKIIGTQSVTTAPHEVFKSNRLRSSEFCADCHQFNFPLFPEGQLHYSKEPMQNTFVEWKAGSSKRQCQFCHYDNHRLQGPHNQRWLKDLFYDFKWNKPSENLLTISFLIYEGRAHNLPSGDLFHSLALETSYDPSFSKIFFVKRWARFYGPGSMSGNTIWNRKLLKDTSIPPNDNLISVTLDVPSEIPLYARLVYYFHDDRLGGKSSLTEGQSRLVLWAAKVQ